jgi:succinate dehydrogenase / fumarate reductase cytochrome b subunit
MTPRPGSRPRQIWRWGDVRRRKLGMWAYVLNRVTGLGLVIYLYLHLVVLGTLIQGPAAWDRFIALASSPLFLALDVLLLAGLLIHGLNGLRVIWLSLGLGLPAQKAWFVVLMLLALFGTAAGALGIFAPR